MAVTKGELVGHKANDATSLVSADGKQIAIQYSMDGGQVIAFSLDFDAMRKLMHSLTETMSASQIDPTMTGGAGFVRMTPIIRSSANRAENVGVVAVCLFDENQTPHYFELPRQASEILRDQLQAAETSSSLGIQVGNA